MKNDDSFLKDVAFGVFAGLAGTVALKGLQMASAKVAPSTLPALRGDPGEYVLSRGKRILPDVVRSKLPETINRPAATALAMGYGAAIGAAYATARPKGGSLLFDGVALGVTAWAAGYLGWLPATGLTPPVWKQNKAQAIAPPIRHALFGMVTVGVYDLLRKL